MLSCIGFAQANQEDALKTLAEVSHTTASDVRRLLQTVPK